MRLPFCQTLARLPELILGPNHLQEQFSWAAAGDALKSPQAWFMTLIFFPAGATLFAIAYFAPSEAQSWLGSSVG